MKIAAIYCAKTATLARYSTIEEAINMAQKASSYNYSWQAGFFVPYEEIDPPLDESLVD